MEQESRQPEDSNVKIIHVKIIGGNEADVWEIGKALKRFKKEADLPYRLEAIVTNDKVELQDVDHLLRELYKLKKQIDMGKKMEDKK
jgi:hypothetical protein